MMNEAHRHFTLTATGADLDDHADAWYGLRRETGEPDESFRKRCLAKWRELLLCTCWRTPDGEEIKPPDCPRHTYAPEPMGVPSKGGAR